MKVTILWVDDEIDFLRPHIMFLEQKGYTMLTANNGQDALDIVRANDLDLIFLDENMPGLRRKTSWIRRLGLRSPTIL